MQEEERYLEGDQAQELIILLKQGAWRKKIKINGKDQLGLILWFVTFWYN